jgi:hypothetical protein
MAAVVFRISSKSRSAADSDSEVFGGNGDVVIGSRAPVEKGAQVGERRSKGGREATKEKRR